MCGISGVLSLTDRPAPLESIRAMNEVQRHRGPDGEGEFRRNEVALGHTRLSVIDVEGGHQPLTNERGDIWLTFNGEVYNYRELREQLIGLGHQFRTESDSEVIVHAYEQWGDACVERFRGMFAFAIADFQRRRVFLARDQLGIKPLFYRADRDRICFASELNALIASEEQVPEIDPQAIDFFLRYRYIPAPRTIYSSILRLPPGHTWSCDFDGRVSGPHGYWKLRMAPSDLDLEDWQDRFAQVIRESVTAHLVADVPFGAFLSGGIDSTLIVANMVEQLGTGIKAFSIGFENQDYSELEYARQAAQALGVELHTEIVQPDVVGIFDQLFRKYGEPFADTSAVPTWYVSRLAREHVTMTLSGDGADEAFAGYGRYDRWMNDGWGRDLRRVFKHPKHLCRRISDQIRGAALNRRDRWESEYVGVFRRADRHSLWRDEYRGVVDVPSSAFTDADREAADWGKLEYAQYLDIKTYLPGDILTKVDIASMSHGLEVRTPFTDVRVMEFAATVPRQLRRRRNGRGATVMKVLPKHFLAKRFPEKFIHRPKRGFAIPESDWLRRGQRVRDCFDDVVADPNSRIRELFCSQQIDRLINGFDQDRRNPTGMWLLMILGFWLEHHHGAQQQTPVALVS